MNARRLVLMRLVIDLMREAYSGRHDDEVFGAHCKRSILVMCIVVGQLEGRPMTAAKLAQFAGIPRVTALRKLDELESAGVVRRTTEKEFVVVDFNETHERWVRTIKAMDRLVRQASTELSTLDGKAIAATTRRTYTSRQR